MTPEQLTEWRESATLDQRAGFGLGWPARVITLIDALDRAEARLSRSVRWDEVIRALRAADVPEDSMATDEDLIRYEGHAEAVRIIRDMLDV